MSITGEALATLLTVAAETEQVAQQMFTDLEAERHALETGDMTALNAAGVAKEHHVRRLETLEHERAQLLAQVALDQNSLSTATMEQALQKNPEALHRWQDSFVLLKRCRELNQANGMVVKLQLGQIRQALELLTGVPANTGSLYSSQGTQASFHHSHSLAKA